MIQVTVSEQNRIDLIPIDSLMSQGRLDPGNRATRKSPIDEDTALGKAVYQQIRGHHPIRNGNKESSRFFSLLR